MATKAWVAKQHRREEIVARYADVRRKLKAEKNYAALARLPRDSQPDPVAPAVRADRAGAGATCGSSGSAGSCSASWPWGRRSPGMKKASW